jgi:hypothetical protein
LITVKVVLHDFHAAFTQRITTKTFPTITNYFILVGIWQNAVTISKLSLNTIDSAVCLV